MLEDRRLRLATEFGRSLAFGAIVASLLTACGGSSATAPNVAPAPLSTPIVAGLLLPPVGTMYLGAFVNSSGLPQATGPTTTAAFETQIGRRLALDSVYHEFISRFPGRDGLDDYAKGRIPLYSWNCGISNAQVAAGAADATLRVQAASIAAYGWPIFVRFMWDMNKSALSWSRAACYDRTTDSANNTFSPAQFIAAWQHIRAIFAQEGAVNAVWLWTVSDSGNDARPYYPGDSQVDWVGMDVYDAAGADFAATFSPMYAQLAAYNKPIMISETGAPAVAQDSFFAQAAPALQTQFPLVRGFVYYDAIGVQDWRVASGALSAFSAFAASPYMRGSYAH